MKNATITFRLSEQEKSSLEEMAARLDVPVSQLIRMFIRQGIETTMSKEDN